jgi:hypothetical protein
MKMVKHLVLPEGNYFGHVGLLRLIFKRILEQIGAYVSAHPVCPYWKHETAPVFGNSLIESFIFTFLRHRFWADLCSTCRD